MPRFALRRCPVLPTEGAWQSGPAIPITRGQPRMTKAPVLSSDAIACGLANASQHPRVWMFSAWDGYAYSDNPRYLFEYVNREKKGIRSVWVARDQAVVKDVQERGYRAVCHGSSEWRGYLDQAEVVLYSDNCYSVIGESPSAAIRINLWHGMPLKVIGHMTEPSDFIFATNSEHAAILGEATGLPPDRVRVVGQPKNDGLYECPPSLRAALAGDAAKVILYLPTYRAGGDHDAKERSDASGVMLPTRDIGRFAKKLNRLLARHDALLLIKPHFRNVAQEGSAPTIDRVKWVDEYAASKDVPDSHRLMGIADVLVTDYSSVLFDYPVLDRPLIVYAPDLREYMWTWGTYFPVAELAHGLLARSQREFLRLLARMLDDPEVGKLERRVLAKRFNAFGDGANSARAYAEVESILSSGFGTTCHRE